MSDPLPADSPPPTPPRRAFNRLAMLLLKILIALAGIAYVVHLVTWQDTAIVKKGAEIRAVRMAGDTDVLVRKVETLPAPPPAVSRVVYTVEFPASVAVDAEAPDGKTRRITIDDHNRESYNFPRQALLPPEFFLATDGEIVHRGLKSTLVAASSRWYLLVLAWAILVIPFLVSSWRWQWLMRPQGLHLPYIKCLQLTFVGQFYSSWLPSITGGDLVKIVYTSQLTGSKSKSFITILLDRVIGLVALMVIAALSAGWQLWANRGLSAAKGTDTLQNVFILIVVILLIMAAGSAVYFSRRLRRLFGLQWFIDIFAMRDGIPESQRHAHLVRLYRAAILLGLASSIAAGAAAALLRWKTHLAWAQHNRTLLLILVIVMAVSSVFWLIALLIHGQIIDRLLPILRRLIELVIHLDEVLHTYRGHFGLLLWAFGISLVSQLTLPISAWISGMAFGVHMSVAYYLAYVPVAIIAISVPSLPQGAGVLDGLIVHFLANRGSATASQAFAVAQAIRFLPILWNLVGAYWVITGQFSRVDKSQSPNNRNQLN